MSIVTVTTIQTVSGFVQPSISDLPTTTTTRVWTTIPATPGETVAVGTTSPYYTPSTGPTQTFTVTEYDIFLEGPQGQIWTTVVLDTSPTDLVSPNSPYPPGERVFVAPYPCAGFSCWSRAQKVGLITGIVFGVLALLLLLCCLRRWHKRKIWVSYGAHGANDYERWQNSNPGWGYYGPPPANLHTGWGLRPYVTQAQAEAVLRGGGPAPVAPPEAVAKKESKEAPEGRRKRIGAWIGR